MYIRVYKKDGKWFRKDNHSLVGKQMQDENILKTLRKIAGDHLFAINNTTENNKIYTIYYGFLDTGEFIFLCKQNKSDCDSCPWYKRSVFCRRRINKSKDKTAGYYIFD